MTAKERGRGRPAALALTKKLLTEVQKLGALRVTEQEVAAHLGVAKSTWMAFKARNKDAIEDAYSTGEGNRKISLRRYQWLAAQKGNIAMLIWLGKQDLDQKEPATIKGVGPGGSIPIIDYSKLSDKELDQLEGLGKKLGLSGFSTDDN